MKCIFSIIVICLILINSSIYAEELPTKSGIADLGMINRNGKQIHFFEIHAVDDISVDPNAKPTPLPTETALDITRNYGSTGSNLTVPIAAFTTLMVAGAETALGYLSQVPYDIASAYNAGLLQAEQEILNIINNIFPSSPSGVPQVGYIQDVPGYPPGTGYMLLVGLDVVAPYPDENQGGFLPSPSYNPVHYYETVGEFQMYRQDFWIFNGTYRSDGVALGTWHQYRWAHRFANPYTIDDVNLPPSGGPPAVISPESTADLVAALAPASIANPNVKNALDNIVKASPQLLSRPAAITPEQVQQYAQEAAQKAIDEHIAELEAAVAANPNDTTLANELSKAKAEKAIRNADQIAEQAEEPPEPNYPVPESWYTPTYDHTKPFSESINYQQVTSASAAWQETAPYQITGLILECLGYVQGNGCTYPPTVSVAFPNYFTTDPIKFDLSPFSTVVDTMKFFFSLLCMVATGKLVMNLFA